MKSKLLKSLSESLTKYGFNNRVYGQSLIKPFEDGVAKLHLSFIDHEDNFDIKVDVAIRFDELEDIINSYNKLLTKKEKAETSSIGVEIGNLTVGEPKRWTIKDETDLEYVYNEILKTIKNIVIPYINKYANMESAFNLCVKDDKEAILNAPIDHKRAMNAVGLAKVLGKTEVIEEVIRQKEKYLRDKDDFGLPIFNDFVEQQIRK